MKRLVSKKLYDIKNERVWRIVNVDDNYTHSQYVIKVETTMRPNSKYAPQSKVVEFNLYREKQNKDIGYRLYDKCSPYMIVEKKELSTLNNFIQVLEQRLQGII